MDRWKLHPPILSKVARFDDCENVARVGDVIWRGGSLPTALRLARRLRQRGICPQAGQLEQTLPRSVRFVEMDAQTTLFQATKAHTQFLYLLVAFKIALQILEFYTGLSLTIGGGSLIGFQ